MQKLIKEEYWVLFKDGEIRSTKNPLELIGYWFEVDGVKYYLKNPYKKQNNGKDDINTQRD